MVEGQEEHLDGALTTRLEQMSKDIEEVKNIALRTHSQLFVGNGQKPLNLRVENNTLMIRIMIGLITAITPAVITLIIWVVKQTVGGQ